MNGPNWLMMMNYTLVLVVVVAWLGLFISVGWELAERRARKARGMSSLDRELSTTLSESHRILVPELGLTMADGGEAPKASDDDTDDADKEKKRK